MDKRIRIRIIIMVVEIVLIILGIVIVGPVREFIDEARWDFSTKDDEIRAQEDREKYINSLDKNKIINI